MGQNSAGKPNVKLIRLLGSYSLNVNVAPNNKSNKCLCQRKSPKSRPVLAKSFHYLLILQLLWLYVG